jgi:hypothetical protein
MTKYMHTPLAVEYMHRARCYLSTQKAEIGTRLYSEKVVHECSSGENGWRVLCK